MDYSNCTAQDLLNMSDTQFAEAVVRMADSGIDMLKLDTPTEEVWQRLKQVRLDYPQLFSREDRLSAIVQHRKNYE